MPSCSVGIATTQFLHDEAVAEQEVVASGETGGGVLPARSVLAPDVAEERRAPRLVERRPGGHAIAEGVVHRHRVVEEAVGGVAGGPAALLLEGLRQIPVVEREPRLDARAEQFIDQARVEVEPGRVRGPAVGADARPGGREAVGLQAEVGHQRDVVTVSVVVVARDIPVVHADDRAGDAAEGIPDRIAATVLVGGALDLVRGRGRAEEEVRREGPGRERCERVSLHP